MCAVEARIAIGARKACALGARGIVFTLVPCTRLAPFLAHFARRAYPQSAMPAQSAEDRREDAYDAARDRRESLRGSAEDQCIADARARYRQ